MTEHRTSDIKKIVPKGTAKNAVIASTGADAPVPQSSAKDSAVIARRP